MKTQHETLENLTLKSPVAIQGVGIVSAFGIGFDAFEQGLLDNNQALSSVEVASNFPSRANQRTVFDEVNALGRKGLTSLDRLSKLSIVACGEALQTVDAELDRTGIVLGTSGAIFESNAEFIHKTYQAEAPHLVSPIKFPNTVMNCSASQCAIRYGLKGINSTVCNGDMSSLIALNYAVRALRLGHADVLIAGGADECSEYSAWAHQALTNDDSQMTDGCALLALGGSTETAMGEILGIKSGRAQEGKAGENRRAKLIAHLLKDSGLSAKEVDWCSLSAETNANSLEVSAIELSGIELTAKHIKPLANLRLGNTHAASFSFQMAASLVSAPSGIGLLTITTRNNQFGCALIRKPWPSV